MKKSFERFLQFFFVALLAGSVATRLPRVRAAGRRREDATHEAGDKALVQSLTGLVEMFDVCKIPQKLCGIDVCRSGFGKIASVQFVMWESLGHIVGR